MGTLKYLGRGATELDEEVEGEEEDAQEDEEGAPGEAAAGKLRDGVNEAGGDDAEAGLAAAFVEGADGNVARKIAAKRGELVVNPESKFGAIAPQEKSAENKNGVAETGKKPESGTGTPFKHGPSLRPSGKR
jgi:hypothetical protein